MHLEAMCEFGDALVGYDCELACCIGEGLQMHLEAVIELDWTSSWRQLMDGTPSADILFNT